MKKLFILFISSNLFLHTQTQLSVTPPFHGVPSSSGYVELDVSNIGTGDMNWTSVSNDPLWLTITSGISGLNDGTIQISYQANSEDYRAGTITITAPDAINSPIDIEVRQTAFGSDWIIKTSGTIEDLNNVMFISDQLGWAVGDSGTVLFTSDGGDIWDKQIIPTNFNLNKIFFINSSTGWAVGDSGTILKTDNGGELWELINAGISTKISSVQFLNENLGWILCGPS